MAGDITVPTRIRMSFRTKQTDNHVPQTFEEMYEGYYEVILKVAVTQGIDRDLASDVVQRFFMRLYERDFRAEVPFARFSLIDKYDPKKTFEHGGQEKTATFRSLIVGTFMKYVRGYREQQQVEANRVGLSFQEVEWDDVTDGESPQIAKLLVATHRIYEEQYRDLHLTEFQRRVREKIAAKAPVRANDPLDLMLLFDMTMLLNDESGEISNREIAELAGISVNSVLTRKKKLAELLADERDDLTALLRPETVMAAA